jgi:hypothetical protein
LPQVFESTRRLSVQNEIVGFNARNSLYFSLLSGNLIAETGSHRSASSARQSKLPSGARQKPKPPVEPAEHHAQASAACSALTDIGPTTGQNPARRCPRHCHRETDRKLVHGAARQAAPLSRAHRCLFRLHVWIRAWCAGRRNDFEMTAAWRRDLHLPVNARGRAYDALRLG